MLLLGEKKKTQKKKIKSRTELVLTKNIRRKRNWSLQKGSNLPDWRRRAPCLGANGRQARWWCGGKNSGESGGTKKTKPKELNPVR